MPPPSTAPVLSVSTATAPPIQPVQPIQPLPAVQGSQLSNTITAGADQFQAGLDKQATDARTAYQTPLTEYVRGLATSQGTAGLTQDAYQANGVNDAQKALTDLNGRILSEKNATQQTIQGLKQNTQGFFGTGMDQAIQKVQDESDARLANLAVQQYVAQGNYQGAREIADRAVQAQYERQQNYLSALKSMADIAREDWTTADKRAFDTAFATRQKDLELQQYSQKAYLDQYIKQNDPAYQEQLKQLQYQNGFIPGQPGGSDPITAASQAILGNESNGSYTSLSPVLTGGSYAGQRSYGKYQVLQSNIPSWTKQYYGQSLTPQEFLNNPAAQEAVQKGKIQDLWNQYGNIQDVASVYFSGVPYAQAVKEGRRDQATGMTVQQYVQNAANRFNASAGGTQTSTQTNPMIASYVDGFRSGDVKLTDVPAALRSAVIAAANNPNYVSQTEQKAALGTYQLADNLLSDPGFNSLFGLAGKVNVGSYIPGTPQQLTKNNIEQLKSTLSLASRGQLKGQGQISDFESKTLSKAATTLNYNLSAADARKVVAQVRGAFLNAAGQPAPVRLTDPSTGKTLTAYATRADITQALKDGARVEYIDPTQQ